MQNNKLKIVVSDLDGTLLNREGTFSKQDTQTLNELGQQGICRVIATGRSLFSADKVLPPGFPIDYLVLSSGAGILDWKTKKLIHRHTMPAQQVGLILDTLLKLNVDFMLQDPLPQNHNFVYYKNKRDNPDFQRRCTVYKDYGKPIELPLQSMVEASQFIVVEPHGSTLADTLAELLPDQKVIRATSPLDGHSVWIEIFPRAVSKARAALWVCDKLGIDHSLSLAVGNDYNDLDLLDWAGHSYAVANAPSEIRKNYRPTTDHNNDGFSLAVKSCLDY